MLKTPNMTVIAEKAKVSRASVYAVLNSPSKTNIGVSAETRKRIQDVAQSLGYVRNATAQSLKTGKYFSIAILAQTISHAKFYRFFSTFDKLATDKGYFTFLVSSELDYDRERQKLNAILEQGVDAVIVGMLDDERNHDLLQQYYRRNIPVVVLGDQREFSHDAFMAGFDEAAGAGLIVEYLKAVGMTRLAYFMHDNLYLRRVGEFTHACERKLTDYSLDIFTCPSSEEDSAGDRLTAELLAKFPQDGLTQAIVCYNDQMASETIAALQERGIKVPDDIAVIGCDNQKELNRHLLPLTTIDLPFEALAEASWKLVESALTLGISGAETAPVLIQPKLVIRHSSPPLPEKSDF